MSTVQPVSGCNLARQMRQSRQRNRQRIFKEWMWTIFTRKTKQIGVVKHGENKHRKYDERDEAEASRTKSTALQFVYPAIISFESGCCWVFINLSVLSLGDIQLTLLVILHAACNVDSLALGHLLRSFCCHTNKVHHATKTERIENEKICFF